MNVSVQTQARALGDPTRHAIFRYLADAEAPVDVAALTEHFRLNHNAIRQHLAKLVDAELILQSTAPPAGRGRPRLRYVVDPGIDSRWGATGPYERLSVLLTEVVQTGDSPAEVGRRAGLGQASKARGEAGTDADPVDVLMDQMASHGFDPRRQGRGTTFNIVLQTCPFVSAVLADPATVCAVHLGLAQGVAEAVGGLEVLELIPKDPRRANCQLRCRVSPTPPVGAT